MKDYRILCLRRGEWTEMASVSGNYQRLNRHRVGPVEAEALRVLVTATNGDDLARIFELRCYA